MHRRKQDYCFGGYLPYQRWESYSRVEVMALVLKDRVKETTTTTGTGTYTLAGAVGGFEAFSQAGNGNTAYYACTDGTDFEIGIGTCMHLVQPWPVPQYCSLVILITLLVGHLALAPSSVRCQHKR